MIQKCGFYGLSLSKLFGRILYSASQGLPIRSSPDYRAGSYLVGARIAHYCINPAAATKIHTEHFAKTLEALEIAVKANSVQVIQQHEMKDN
jgi:hypothetical protein